MTKKMIFDPEDAPAIATRFWDKVAKSDGCWLWTAGHSNGYGMLVINGANKLAHRVAYALTYGPDSLGALHVLHRCDNPQCVRPDHLWLGTPKQNSDDMIAKGRQTLGARNPNAKLNPEAVRYIRLVAVDVAGVAHCMVKFNVHPVTIAGVVARKTWKHVADET